MVAMAHHRRVGVATRHSRRVLDNTRRQRYNRTRRRRNRFIDSMVRHEDNQMDVQTPVIYPGLEVELPIGRVEVFSCNENYVTFVTHLHGEMVTPTMGTVMSRKEFVDKYISQSRRVHFVVVSSRKYGQPKLVKPLELKRIPPVFSVPFLKNCSCQCFILGDDLWIKHMDWCSKEVYNHNHKFRKKFIYNDSFGCVVLRGTAWLKLENVVEMVRKEHQLTSKAAILKAMAETCRVEYEDLCVGDWERFFDRVILMARNSNTGNQTGINCTSQIGEMSWN
jgi:hypothetical protein